MIAAMIQKAGYSMNDGTGFLGQGLVSDDGDSLDFSPPPVALPPAATDVAPTATNIRTTTPTDVGGFDVPKPSIITQSFPPVVPPTDLGGSSLAGFGTLGMQQPPIQVEPLQAGSGDSGTGLVGGTVGGGGSLLMAPDGGDIVGTAGQPATTASNAAQQAAAVLANDPFATTTPVASSTANLPPANVQVPNLTSAPTGDSGPSAPLDANAGSMVNAPAILAPSGALTTDAKNVAIATGALNANTAAELIDAATAVPSYVGVSTLSPAGVQSLTPATISPPITPAANVMTKKQNTLMIIAALATLAMAAFYFTHRHGRA